MLKIELSPDQIAKINRKVKGRIRTFATMFAQELGNEMVIGTPVKLGFLRGSWFSGVNTPPAGTGSADPGGGETISRINQVALTLTVGDIWYLVNTAVYAARIEWGFFGTDALGRKINQAGRGFVRAVVARAGTIARQVAKRVASGEYD